MFSKRYVEFILTFTSATAATEDVALVVDNGDAKATVDNGEKPSHDVAKRNGVCTETLGDQTEEPSNDVVKRDSVFRETLGDQEETISVIYTNTQCSTTMARLDGSAVQSQVHNNRHRVY